MHLTQIPHKIPASRGFGPRQTTVQVVSLRCLCALFKTVTIYLCRPMLFGLMSAGADKAGATHSFQQKVFQVISTPASAATQQFATAWSSRGIRLSPIRLDVSNLGASKQIRSYEALTPVSALAPVALHASQAAIPGEALPYLLHQPSKHLLPDLSP